MGIFSGIGQAWSFARQVEELFKVQDNVERSLNKLEERLHQLENRMTHLEADRGQMITEAKAAAGIAASAVAGTILSDAITRITRLEMRQPEAPALPRLPET
jgi:phage shock protein A